MISQLAAIPSPSFNSFPIGPLDLRLYGLLIGLGILVGVWLGQRKMVERGEDPEIISTIAIWCIPAALIGARIYYVATNWARFSDDPAAGFRIWEGGLGIPGGVLLGAVVTIWLARRNEWKLPPILDAAAVALPTGQIIGRFGNWFNQELYGKPTEVPWALEIDADNRVNGFEEFATFHPTFLYEILWNLGLLAFLLWLDRQRVLRPGRLFTVYLLGYGVGRLWLEFVRIDPVSEWFGLRAHAWAMIVAIGATLAYVLFDARRHGSFFAKSNPTDDAEGDGSAEEADETASADEDNANDTADKTDSTDKTEASTKTDTADKTDSADKTEASTKTAPAKIGASSKTASATTQSKAKVADKGKATTTDDEDAGFTVVDKVADPD